MSPTPSWQPPSGVHQRLHQVGVALRERRLGVPVHGDEVPYRALGGEVPRGLVLHLEEAIHLGQELAMAPLHGLGRQGVGRSVWHGALAHKAAADVREVVGAGQQVEGDAGGRVAALQAARAKVAQRRLLPAGPPPLLVVRAAEAAVQRGGHGLGVDIQVALAFEGRAGVNGPGHLQRHGDQGEGLRRMILGHIPDGGGGHGALDGAIHDAGLPAADAGASRGLKDVSNGVGEEGREVHQRQVPKVACLHRHHGIAQEAGLQVKARPGEGGNELLQLHVSLPVRRAAGLHAVSLEKVCGGAHCGSVLQVLRALLVVEVIAAHLQAAEPHVRAEHLAGRRHIGEHHKGAVGVQLGGRHQHRHHHSACVLIVAANIAADKGDAGRVVLAEEGGVRHIWVKLLHRDLRPRDETVCQHHARRLHRQPRGVPLCRAATDIIARLELAGAAEHCLPNALWHVAPLHPLLKRDRHNVLAEPLVLRHWERPEARR
mmetsp:Transcript_42025/g.105438  ORF Transcript_42025/g.105438 Transcript_42025/m.105438 type:complete len:487 (+) Transcript_42025:193-1653(+)